MSFLPEIYLSIYGCATARQGFYCFRLGRIQAVCSLLSIDNSAMSSPRGSGSPRDGRGKRDNGKPEMLLGKGIVPIHVPKTARPTSSRFQKYSDHLPDRYLSQMTPFSTPLYDARVHVARAKSHFKRKLHNLISIFVRVDKNQNGLIPRTEVRCCSVCTCTPRRAAAVPHARGRHRCSAYGTHVRRRAAHTGEARLWHARLEGWRIVRANAPMNGPMCPWHPSWCLEGLTLTITLTITLTLTLTLTRRAQGRGATAASSD